MSAIVDDLKNYMLYNKKIYLPINDDDRKNGSAIYLLTPNLNSSKDILGDVYNHTKYDGAINWASYYMEKDMSFYFHTESHKMSRLRSNLILEDSEYTLETNVKGTLSEFKRVEISEELIDQYSGDCDDVNGLIGYFPWTGYLYMNENDQIVAGLNVNVDDRDIHKIFVVDEEKYGYLYKDLIAEARKMKANYCTISKNNTSAIKALEEFGFTKTEDLVDNIKMQFKIPITESTRESEVIDFLEHSTMFRHIKNNIQFTEQYKAFKKLVIYYCEFFNIKKEIGILGAIIVCSNNLINPEELRGNLKILNYMSQEEIAIAYKAAMGAYEHKFIGENIYDRILFDGYRLIHFTDINVIIRDEVLAYYDEHSINGRWDNNFLYMNEVEEIVENIKRKHSTSSPNHMILNLSYSYYRKAHKKVQSAINKGLTNKIIIDYRVTVKESAEDDIAANILNESHISFGYEDEKFTNYDPDWRFKLFPNHRGPGFGFTTKTDSKNLRGIIISSGTEVKGVIGVDEYNNIIEMYWTDINPTFLLMIAERKFYANKVAVPRGYKVAIEALQECSSWCEVERDEHEIHFDCYSQERIPYKDIGITKNVANIFNRLSSTDKEYLGNQYLNPVCISSTIWSKVLEDTALVDVYVQPTMPKIGWIDIAVVESQRGKGYALRLIRETQEEIKTKFKDIDALGWVCHKDNTASYNLATKAGFYPYKEVEDHKYLLWTIHNTDMIPNTFIEETEETEWTVKGIEESSTINGDGVMMFIDEDVSKVMDDAKFGSKLKKIMWEDRIRNNKQVLQIYDSVKKDTNGGIKYTYLDLNLYKGRNLFVDLSFYNISFFNNYTKAAPNERGLNEMYFELVSRLINDKRIKDKYKKINVIIPIEDWCKEDIKKYKAEAVRKADYWENLSPIGCFLFYAEKNPLRLRQEFKNINFIFISESGSFFKTNFTDYDKSKDFVKFRTAVHSLLKRVHIPKDETYDKKAIVHSVLDKMESNGENKVVINSIIAKPEEPGSIDIHDPADMNEEQKKKAVVTKITNAAEKSKSPEDVVDTMSKDNEYAKEYTEKLLKDLADNETGNVKLSAARSKRLDSLSEKFLSQKVVDNKAKFNGTMEEYINYNSNAEELPETALPIESINEGWKHLKFTNFDARYSVRSDIYAILYSFENKTSRLSIRDKIDIVDTSTTEDWKETWTVPFEADTGKRFKLKFDVPLLKDNRNMVLGGNDKTMNGQLVLLPISKTDEDTAQIVSLYNKIFIRRYSMGNCKANRETDRLNKAIEIFTKEHPNIMKITYGDSSKSNVKYALPFDYTELASMYYSIELYKNNKLELKILFNQDQARKEAGLKDDDTRMPYGYTVRNGKKETLFWYTDDRMVFASQVVGVISGRSIEFYDVYKKIKPGAKHCYSKASILGTEIPVIIIMAYCEGLIEALRKAHINYIISDKRVNSYNDTHDMIKFSDAYLYYEDTYIGSMLMNGIKDVDTKSHSIQEVDSKSMWTEFLDEYGGRAKSDGLDNFYDLMMDPITIEVCNVYKLPTDFCEMLAYANLLLSTNEYIKHTDLSSNRYRTNEMIAVHAYKCLAKAYANYRLQLKKERSNVAMTMKQSAIIDSIMEESIMSDLSIMNPNLEAEAINSVGFKGLTGMNNDRSYSLDKRTYDKSMTNKIAMSTGFAGNVGVNRQTTIDMQIYGTRGYIKNSDMKDASVTNTLSITEALTPFGSTRDDPFRTAMTNIQTSKHNMRIKESMPMLVTCGADQALPYLTGDTFSFKAKGNGKVIKKNDDYMVVEYDNKTREMIDLRENVKKNSDGGFYITVKLDTNLKKGSRFKEKDILAYDKVVYNDSVGDGKNIAYCVGALANVAYLNTDEGFEDSAIISNRLAEALSSEVVVEVAKNLPCNTNIFDIVKKGTKVQEGDTLLLFQSPFEEEDANRIVKNLAMDKKEVSELGRIPLRSKVTGVVQDVKLYRTVELSEMSPSLRKLFKEYESKIEVMRKDSEGMLNKVPLEANYKLPAVSKMKNLEGKVRIEFYIKYNDKMGIGDKLVFYSAVKGETKNIFPRGLEPYTDDRGSSEIIDSLCPLPSLLHRMVASVTIVTGLYKGVVELTRYMKEAVGLKYIPYNPREEIKK